MTAPRHALCPAGQLHDVTAVAARLDVSVKTVRRMIERGQLPAHRIGKLLRISEADLVDYLSQARSQRL
jgi:excisionase family DNA binding protein